MSLLRFGLVGLGRRGRLHLRTLQAMPQVQVTVIADHHRVEPGIECVSAAERLLGRIDAAVVATPAQDHVEASKLLLENGIGCLVEKPLALTAADADQLVAAAARSGAALAVGHSERFNPQVERAAQLLSAHPVGARVIRKTTGGSADAADVVADLLIHDLDWVCMTLGRPEGVTIRHAEPTAGDGLRLVHCSLDFPGGRSVELYAEHGAAHARRTLDLPDGSRLDLATPAGLSPDPLTAQATAFVAQLAGEPSGAATGESGAYAVRLADQVRQVARVGSP